MEKCINLLSANPTKWSSTLKQFVCNFPTNCLSVFDLFVGLGLKELTRFGDAHRLMYKTSNSYIVAIMSGRGC